MTLCDFPPKKFKHSSLLIWNLEIIIFTVVVKIDCVVNYIKWCVFNCKSDIGLFIWRYSDILCETYYEIKQFYHEFSWNISLTPCPS